MSRRKKQKIDLKESDDKSAISEENIIGDANAADKKNTTPDKKNINQCKQLKSV